MKSLSKTIRLPKMAIITSTGKRYRKLLFLRSLMVFLPLAVICIVGATVIYQAEVTASLVKSQAAEMVKVRLSSRSIQRVMQSVKNDLSFLISSHGFTEYIKGNRDPDDSHVHSDWINFIRHKKIYDQIRWIDVNGKEQIRVHFKDGVPVSVNIDKLKNQKQRYYFKETMRLQKDTFFVSPLDLNVEGGNIELPIKPMIRIGMPVFDQSGNRLGILLLNYLGDKLLREMDHATGKNTSNVWLINQDGYWLKGPSIDFEWGFMYQRPKATMGYLYPEAWRRITSANEGQFETQDGLWSFATETPFPDGESNSNSQHSINIWKNVSLLPPSEYRLSNLRALTQINISTAILLIIFFIGSLQLAKTSVKEKISSDKLHQLNEGLERTVAERTHELNEAKNAAEMMARTDSLTGLNNHRSFFEYARTINNTAKRYRQKYAFIMLDLDFFKQVNDNYGHQTGDKTLQLVGKAIADVIRSPDVAGRVGGEEFAIVLPESSVDSAKVLAQRLRNEIMAIRLEWGDDILRFTASFGVSEYDPGDSSFEDVMNRADDALYQAKDQGRNRVVSFTPERPPQV